MNRELPSSPLPEPRVDLHSHSHFSDGEHSPAAVARMASEAGVAALALTDHDCIDGFPEFQKAAKGFEAVCGVEVSARRDHSDVHMLGLFITPGDTLLRQRLSALAEVRVKRSRAMLARLRSQGIDIPEALLLALSPQGTLGRPHLAHALVRVGAARSVDDAFKRWLRPGTPGYVPKPGPTPEEAIEWIHAAGGVAVLAHPGILRRNRWIEEFAAAGLDGLEIWHPKHNPAQRRSLAERADRLDLVPSGGSDYHGAAVGDARVGQEPVPLDCLQRLRSRRTQT